MIERLVGLIESAARRQVAVIGDVIADEFISGQPSRISREAPVLILKYNATTVLPGGAGNAAANVAGLGGSARLVGLVGKSDVDRRVVRSLPRRVARGGLIRSSDYHVPVKTRILAGGLHSSRQQIVRIDRESDIPTDPDTRLAFERAVRQSLVGCDAVLVSDYGSGLVTPHLVATIKRRLASSRRRRPVPGRCRFTLRPVALPSGVRMHAERGGGRAGARYHYRRRPYAFRARWSCAAEKAAPEGRRADPRKSRNGGVRAWSADGPHPGVRNRRGCRRHGGRRYRHRDDHAGAGRWRIPL